MYSDFVFLDRFLFELSCKNTHTHTNTDTHTHRDSNEYPIVAFSKNATIIRLKVIHIITVIKGYKIKMMMEKLLVYMYSVCVLVKFVKMLLFDNNVSILTWFSTKVSKLQRNISDF